MNNPDIVEFDTEFKNLQNSYFHFETIPSTNSYLLDADAEHGTVALADYQTSGRGRKHRKWLTPKSKSLLFSILLQENLEELPHYIYTFLSSVAVYEAIDKCSKSANPALKWPNDVLLNSKKVCGILTESKANSNRLKKVVVGIGLNINQGQEYFADNDLKFGTSLRIETGKNYDLKRILESVLSHFDQNLSLAFAKGGEHILNKWRKYCPYINRTITLTTDHARVSGVFKDIADDGGLVLKIGEEEKKFYAGDVSFDKRSL